MSKYTKGTLQKLENIFGELEYKVRYEKGNFKSGYCIVEDRKIAVINRFFDTEARVQTLLDILLHMNIDTEKLEEGAQTFLNRLLSRKAANA